MELTKLQTYGHKVLLTRDTAGHELDILRKLHAAALRTVAKYDLINVTIELSMQAPSAPSGMKPLILWVGGECDYFPNNPFNDYFLTVGFELAVELTGYEREDPAC